jgi:hypothetical protein
MPSPAENAMLIYEALSADGPLKPRFTMKKVLAIAVILPVFVVAALTFAGASKASTVPGYVSDSTCAAKASTLGYIDCTTKCLVKGSQTVLVVDQTQGILTIDNPEIVKGYECHHILVTGDVNIHTSVIHIYSVRML